MKPSVVGAFFASLLVTTGLTASSFLGIYLLIAIRKETKRVTHLRTLTERQVEERPAVWAA